jgi:hypothetical protein
VSDLETRLIALESARPRWLDGGDAPLAGVLAAGHTGLEAQLRLLAEVGQSRQICLRPEPPAGLTPVAPLPPAPLPYLAEALRPLFRRVLKAQGDRATSEALLTLLEARGVMAHPFDWLPPRDIQGYPLVYAALSDWAAGLVASDATAELTDESWDDFAPAARLAALTRLRGADPAAARTLLQARLAGVLAEDRQRLVAALAVGLSDADTPLLEGLVGDRSTKVQETARGLLARLGVAVGDEDAAELAAFYEVKKALLTRRVSVQSKAKLNSAQLRRRQELLARLPVGALAAALGLDEAGLAAAWVIDDDGSLGLLDAFVRSGSDAGLRALWDRLDTKQTEGWLARIAGRLSPSEIEAEAVGLLKRGRVQDPVALAALVGPGMSDALGRALIDSHPVAEILTPKAQGADVRLAGLLRGLGLVLPAPTARMLTDRLTRQHLSPHDPVLDALTLNAALAEGTAR